MHIGGRWGARPAVAAVRRGACRLTRAPAFGVAAIAPLVFASAVGGAAPVFPGRTAPVHAVITPVAAVAASGIDLSGPVVIAMKRPPTSFRVAVATISAPPPPMIVNSPGALGIPAMALSAYRNAELKMAAAAPGCGVSWNLLAGIGRIESMHANGGATDARHRDPADLRPNAGRHPARQRDHHPKQRRQSRHVRPRDGANAVLARHLGSVRHRRR